MGLSFAVAFSTLNFLATLLINVVDAAYTCHALDLEVGNLCTPACNRLSTPACNPLSTPACNRTYPACNVPSLQLHVPSLQPHGPSL